MTVKMTMQQTGRFFASVGMKTCRLCKRYTRSKGGKVNKLGAGFVCAQCVAKRTSDLRELEKGG